MGPREAKKAKRQKSGFLPFCPLRLSCCRRLSSSSMRAPTFSSTRRRRSSPSPVLRPIEAEGAHCLYRESHFVPPLSVYVFPPHKICQSRRQHGSLDLLQLSGQTGAKQSTHAATKFITFFILALACPIAIGAPFFSLPSGKR